MRLDEPKTKKKPKAVEPPSGEKFAREAKEATARTAAAKAKAKTGPGFRGNVRGGLTLEDLKKRKAARDRKKEEGKSEPTKPQGKATTVHTDKAKRHKKVKPIKPKKKKNPKKPKKDSVKTTPTVKAVTYGAIDLNSQYDEQKAAILNAYLALAGTELFQYVNSQSIDGAYNDVAIINVLSRRRQEYTPNRLIELAEVFIKYMWVEDGNLCIEIDDDADLWDVCVLSFTVGSDVIVAKTIN